MKTTIPVTQAQAELPALMRTGQTFTVVRHGEPLYVMVPYERMQSLLETMDLMSNPDFMRALADFRAGKGGKSKSLRQFEKEMDALERKG